MATVVLCCNTLEDEINLALRNCGLDYEIVWLEAGWHNHPDKLRSHIADSLNRLEGVERALMAMGHCGGACAGLPPFAFELVIPRADDCLSLLLGSMEKRQRASREAPTYFLTAGWLRHTENLITSFSRDREVFGPERAERVYRIMLNHYRRFGFIDTGAYAPEGEEAKTLELAGLIGIRTERLAGDMAWLERLLTGPWDSGDFIVVPAGEALSAEKWNWPAGMAMQI